MKKEIRYKLSPSILNLVRNEKFLNYQMLANYILAKMCEDIFKHFGSEFPEPMAFYREYVADTIESPSGSTNSLTMVCEMMLLERFEERLTEFFNEWCKLKELDSSSTLLIFEIPQKLYSIHDTSDCISHEKRNYECFYLLSPIPFIKFDHVPCSEL